MLLLVVCALMCVTGAQADVKVPFSDRDHVWIECEDAQISSGLLKVDRPLASGSRLLAVQADKVAEAHCEWEIAVKNRIPTPDIYVRHSSMISPRLAVYLDGKSMGVVTLPATGGWGYEDQTFGWSVFRIGSDIDEGKHTLRLRSVNQTPVNLDCIVITESTESVPFNRIQLVREKESKEIVLTDWKQPEADFEPVSVGYGWMEKYGSPISGLNFYSKEFLPAFFKRTLVIDDVAFNKGSLRWIFTGQQGGFTLSIHENSLTVFQRYYNSYGLNHLNENTVTPALHPEKRWTEDKVRIRGKLKAITVELNDKLDLVVSLNGKEVIRQHCLLGVNRHQINFEGSSGTLKGAVLRPKASEAAVTVRPDIRHQPIMGFGGTAIPTAYHMLSTQGKRRWWELIAEYNLLIHRENPMGARLNEEMSNWDNLGEATPHYYSDNFPNGDVSCFEYIKNIRKLGGKVFFEFWYLPLWARLGGTEETGNKRRSHVADVDKYTRAMLGYCKTSVEKVGVPPDVVGIQNEVEQPEEVWHEMTLALRRELDKAGFNDVKIHMPDAAYLNYKNPGWSGTPRVKAIKKNGEAWKATDYCATHLYDYEAEFLKNPDGYDARIAEWNEAVDGKPFLSTEICTINAKYQVPSYSVAFNMGQLYHKNMTMMNARALLFCWTLVTVEQPSFGWTRSLFVPDLENGFMPKPSSNQLRVYGAFSRRIKEGMVRIDATSSDKDLLVSAYSGKKGGTVVLLNRSTAPKVARLTGLTFIPRHMEIVDPYNQNSVLQAPSAGSDGVVTVRVDPGAIVTLTDVPLGSLPKVQEIPVDNR